MENHRVDYSDDLVNLWRTKVLATVRSSPLLPVVMTTLSISMMAP